MDSEQWQIRESGAGLDLAIQVQPRARRNEIAGFHNGSLKVKLSAPPVEDAANRALLEFFSELLKIPQSRLSIVAGHKSRSKTLRVEAMSLREFLSRWTQV